MYRRDGVQKMKNTSKGNLYILSAAVLWSTGGLVMKAVPFNGIVVNFFRTVFAFLFFAAVRRSFRIQINRTILLGAICFFASTTLCACSNKMTTAANAIVLQYTALFCPGDAVYPGQNSAEAKGSGPSGMRLFRYGPLFL